MVRIVIETDDLLSVPAAAKELGKPPLTIYRWIDSGKIIAVQFGKEDRPNVLFIHKKEVERVGKLLEEGKKTEVKKNGTG